MGKLREKWVKKIISWVCNPYRGGDEAIVKIFSLSQAVGRNREEMEITRKDEKSWFNLTRENVG